MNHYSHHNHNYTLIAHLAVEHTTIEIEYTGEQCGLEDKRLVPDPAN
jgi:hypothetical protein